MQTILKIYNLPTGERPWQLQGRGKGTVLMPADSCELHRSVCAVEILIVNTGKPMPEVGKGYVSVSQRPTLPAS